MQTEPICLNDSQNYSINCFPRIAASLSQYPEICVVNEKSFQFKFTGVVVINDIPVIVFPKNYTLPSEYKAIIGEASTLIRVLLRYRNEPNHEIEENVFLFGDKRNNNSRITTAIKIMEDYKTYGYIRRDVEISSKSKKGRIDWAATVNKTIPTINHNKVIYDDPIIRCSMVDNENIVYRLHKYVVSQCIHMWGWLFGIREVRDSSINLKLNDIKDALYLLTKELRNVYVQREINVINMMIAYLTAQAGNDKKLCKEILGTQYFSFIWEAICGYLFNNKYPMLKRLVPQPEWQSDVVGGRISQRPDIFTTREKYLYIIDAKYYNYKMNLPGWHDVVKQLFYRQTVMLNLTKQKGIKLLPKDTVVKNVFLFPGEENDLLKFIGRVFVNDIDELGEVKAFAINQRTAMETYAYRNNDIYRKELMEELVCKA